MSDRQKLTTDLSEAATDIGKVWLPPYLAARIIEQLADKGWTISRTPAPLPTTTDLHQSMLDEIHRERAARRSLGGVVALPVDLHPSSCICHICDPYCRETRT